MRLINRKGPFARAFETVTLGLRQANQERWSAVVKRDRLSGIDITGRAVDHLGT